MRSNWPRDANYLLFRASPLVTGHHEQEALDVQIWAHGREIMSNGGGGFYEKSKWRIYGTSAYSHSTVIVDESTIQTKRAKGRLMSAGSRI